MLYQRDKTEIIGIVPKEAAVGSADNGVHGTDFSRGSFRVRGDTVDVCIGYGENDSPMDAFIERMNAAQKLYDMV